MDETWAHYAERDKSEKKTSTVWYHIYVESEKVKPVKNIVKWWLPGDGGWNKDNGI